MNRIADTVADGMTVAVGAIVVMELGAGRVGAIEAKVEARGVAEQAARRIASRATWLRFTFSQRR
jgi:hypothetical protein